MQQRASAALVWRADLVAALHRKRRGGSRERCRGSRAGFIVVQEAWHGAQASGQAAAADASVLH
jgi:hypothetical protein